MAKTFRNVVAVSLLLALGACVREPFPPVYYTSPAPPPLQPYMGPPIAPVAEAAPAPRVIKRRYVRKRYYHRRARCRCTPY